MGRQRDDGRRRAFLLLLLGVVAIAAVLWYASLWGVPRIGVSAVTA